MFRFDCGDGWAPLAFWVIGAALIAGTVLLLWWASKRRAKLLARLVTNEALAAVLSTVSATRRRWKAIAALAAITLTVFALARPQWGTRLEEVKRSGIDLVVVLDVSQSMLAEDVKPNRLERAKQEIKALMDELQGDRVGLVIFAGKAFVNCPLTLDYGAMKMFLDDVDTRSIPVPGTAVAEALTTAVKCFDQKDRQYRAVLLITDGEDFGKGVDEAAKAANDEGVRIFTVGMGSPEGERIPIKDQYGHNSGYLKDRKGETVFTKLDESTLEKIALQTGGKYYRGTSTQTELDAIFKELNGLQKRDLASKKFSRFEERFMWFLIPAVLLWLLEAVITDRKGKDRLGGRTWRDVVLGRAARRTSESAA